MNFIDIITIIIVVALCIRGYLKGFINELFSLGIVVIGLAVSFLFYRPLGVILGEHLNPEIAPLISFFIILVTVAVFLVIIRNALTSIIDRINLTDIDYLLGVAVGFIKGVILCGFVFIFLKHHPLLNVDVVIARSKLYPVVERVFLALVSLLPGTFESFILKILGV